LVLFLIIPFCCLAFLSEAVKASDGGGKLKADFVEYLIGGKCDGLTGKKLGIKYGRFSFKELSFVLK